MLGMSYVRSASGNEDTVNTGRVVIPLNRRVADALIHQHETLRRASDTLFDPGRVELVDAYWRDFCDRVQESVNAKLQSRS